MYFLFLTCEVKCSAIALNVVDQQNAYSITIIIKGICQTLQTYKAQKGALLRDYYFLDLVQL